MALWEPGQALPVCYTLDGFEVVIVDAADYRELVKVAGRAAFTAATAGKSAMPPSKGRKGSSTIERDPEVADFLRERFARRMTLEQLRADCLRCFGIERTPSIGRITVFRQRATRR